METAATFIADNTPNYLKTKAGIIKLWCLTFNFFAFIINLLHPINITFRPSFEFEEIALGSFITTIIFLILFYHQNESDLQKLQWIKIEMYFCGLWTVLYICVIVLNIIGNYTCILRLDLVSCYSHVFATSFGFLAMLGYAYDCSYKYREINRRGVIRTGQNLQQQPNSYTNRNDAIISPTASMRRNEFIDRQDSDHIILIN